MALHQVPGAGVQLGVGVADDQPARSDRLLEQAAERESGVEAGIEDIFPDTFAAGFAQQFESSPKAAERQFAGITVDTLFGSAA